MLSCYDDFTPIISRLYIHPVKKKKNGESYTNLRTMGYDHFQQNTPRFGGDYARDNDGREL